MADHGIDCSMSRSGNVWDNAAMESFFSSMKTEQCRCFPVRVAEKLLSYEPVRELRQGDPSQRCCSRCHQGEEHGVRPWKFKPDKATAIHVGGANAGMMFNPKIRPNKRTR